MALVGPLTSLAVGALSLVLARFVPAATAFPAHFGLFYFGYLNLFLGAFNLLPAFPMDGGRILRAALTRPLGRARATRVAATVGKVFAGLLFVLGLFTLNFILMLVALFVWFGAEAERQNEQLTSAVAGVSVRQVMRPAEATIDERASLEDALDEMRRTRRERLFAVDGDRLRGAISLEQLTDRPPDARGREEVEAVMSPVKALRPDDSLLAVLRTFGERAMPSTLPVIDESGRLVGVLDRDELGKSLRFLELEARERQAQARRGLAERKSEENP